MLWRHEVSKDWMIARRKYLTASEVAKLIPKVKKLKEKENKGEELTSKDYKDFIKMYLTKSTKEEPIVHAPSSSAARGHELEPYAVEEFNNYEKELPRQYHWDDVIITSKAFVDMAKVNKYPGLPLGFSPDAMNVQQQVQIEACVGIENNKLYDAKGIENESMPTEILEIKSYGADRHVTCVFTEKMKHKERYQIATAMLVCPTINYGNLIFYNPSCQEPIHTVRYSREDLEEEISQVMHTWQTMCCAIDTFWKEKGMPTQTMYSEEAIYIKSLKNKNKGNILKGK